VNPSADELAARIRGPSHDRMRSRGGRAGLCELSSAGPPCLAAPWPRVSLRQR